MTKHWFTAHLTRKFTRGKKLGLDVGSGYGNWNEFKECKMVGIDIRPHEAVDIIVDCNRELPFIQESFDIVICYSTLEYLSSKDILLKEIHRVLKKDGLFVCITQNKMLNQNNLNILLKNAGFSSVFMRYFKEWLYATWYNLTSVYAYAIVQPQK